ncbi:phospholipase D/Transphosphatidylase [Geobacter metallireducens RCH3]|uniref:Cardiolipin synthase n=1 Tax=Geobacter metallireducens (strain ATCC 53774 / DSM 7210 / GS-15) TaxID=269799 RepID=Q39ZL0_GEOMG|nr:cardiolipin synthase [Geobacter metallireducens]ABB30314.1 cardiolipin synthase, putative [Geobacter metallireducens GS-15]EHP84907.1 phospholipase D/Transphosphatidylase [Geobacter metallireducens RCH3]
MIDELALALGTAALIALSLFSAGHALIMKRDPRSSLGWIVTCLTIPLLGPFFYWGMGVNRIFRRARTWLESGRRLADPEFFKSTLEQNTATALPPGAEYLSELRRLADRVVSTPLVTGNRFTPLVNGEGAYPAMLEAIAGARRSIHLSTYIFDSDAAGRRFIDALADAARRGVDVRVIIDGLGEKYSFPRARTLMERTGIRVARFLPLRQGFYMNLRNHRKMLIIDGERAFTGGMNIGDRHMVERPLPTVVKDLHFAVAGPVVGELQQIFLEDWYFVSGELLDNRHHFPPLPAAGHAISRAIGDGPDKEFRKLFLILMGALSCATRQVQIMTPYFIPDRALVAALVTTALRGVEVTLVLPEKNNLPFVHWASRAYLWELLQQGIRVFYQPPPFVHTKLFIVDGLWSLIGSANLDPRSLRLNFELNLEVYDREFAGTLTKHVAGVLARSREVTLEQMDNRPLPEKLRDGVAKLFSPYL